MSETEVQDFLDGVDNEKRRRDAESLLQVMQQATGEEPKMWGSIIGFGEYHYRYESGREGDAPAAGFSPRKGSSTIYVSDGVEAHSDLLEHLGPHTTGVGCIYLKDVEAVDLDVLSQIVERSYSTLSAGTYTQRAREGKPPSGT